MLLISIISFAMGVLLPCLCAETIDPLRLVTTPGTCFSSSDCPDSQYCTLPIGPSSDSGLLPPFVCAARLGRGSLCLDDRSCSAELYCTMRGAPADENGFIASRCRPKEQPGDPCDLFDQAPCVNGTFCASGTSKCTRGTPPPKAGLGEQCVNSDRCDENAGLYCKRGEDGGMGSCERKLRQGTRCNNNVACTGTCLRDPSSNNGIGKCVAPRRRLQRCTSDTPCTDGLLCNHGRCMRHSELFSTLGTSCWNVIDRCDEARSMRCAWSAPTRATVCQQIYRVLGFEALPYCTPRSNLSRCGEGDECRLDDYAFYSRFDAESAPVSRPFYQCRRRVQVVRRGTSCSAPGQEQARCALGLTCVAVPAVRRALSFRGLDDNTFRTCVKTARLGEGCAQKFRTACGNGLVCAASGRCVNDTGTRPPGNETHAGLNSRCTDIPCAPGLLCRQNGPNVKTCQRPVVTATIDRHCLSDARSVRRCAGDLRCVRSARGFGLRLCRQALAVGSPCDATEQCSENAACVGKRVNAVTSRVVPGSGVCFKSTGALAPGDACTRGEEADDMKCVAAPDGRRMQCMQNEDKQNVCKIVAGLLQECDTQNVVCDMAFRCSSFGLCI